MTRHAARMLAIALASVSLVACNNEEGGSDAAPAPPAGATTTPTTAPSTTPTTSTTTGADPVEGTQATPDGTVFLFVESLKDADLQTAADLTDETSVGHADIADMVKALARLDEEKQKAIDAGGSGAQYDSIKEMLIARIATPWADVKTTPISQREDRARFSFEFPVPATAEGPGEPNVLEIEVVKKDDLWYLFAPKGILDAGIAKTPVPAGQANTPG